jgi:hypothetical protein
MCVYILGAGASYGYDASLPSILTPPMTDEFFIKGVQWGNLVENRYPKLTNRLKSQYQWKGTNQENDLQKIREDIEPFLVEVGNEFEKREPDAQSVLGETTYFILDLLKHFRITGQNRFDCYRRLALSYLDMPYYVVTLNYDILLESAINAVGLNYVYGEPILPKSIPIAKIHGSISWLNPIGHGIALGGLKAGDIPSVARNIYSNRIEMQRPLMLGVPQVANLSDFDIVRAGNDYYEPIIVPPQGEFKDFRKFKILEEVWQWTQSLVSFADEVVIIGCSLRQEDSRLWHLMSSLKKGAKLTLVNPKADALKENILKNNRELHVQEQFKDFQEFAKTL